MKLLFGTQVSVRRPDLKGGWGSTGSSLGAEAEVRKGHVVLCVGARGGEFLRDDHRGAWLVGCVQTRHGWGGGTVGRVDGAQVEAVEFDGLGLSLRDPRADWRGVGYFPWGGIAGETAVGDGVGVYGCRRLGGGCGGCC